MPVMKKHTLDPRKLMVVIAIALIAISILLVWNTKNNTQLSRNGVETTAVISNLKRDYRRVNEMADIWIDTYIIEYQFTVDTDTILGVSLLRAEELDVYFKDLPELRDKVNIRYDSTNVYHSQLVRRIEL
ncbi:hypothetical protein EV197_3143 [Aquimarina brevivitae]|uniref:Uncharacterized protein n=2 Tax=Aquimarina brevivitae TaxID=323412 RepID=A0A4Q7NU29_9FLAO|nr:hypothetical protein EV197_3143 [Aquimarina brevivitae]